MKKIKKQIEYSNLLAGKVLDSLTEEQKSDLQQWESDPYNKKVEEEILNPEAFNAWQTKVQNINTSEQWELFLKNKKATSADKSKVIKMKVLKWSASIAAIFILGFSLNLFFNTSNGKKYQTAKEVNINPGTPQAELVLSTGETVKLQDSVKTNISEGTITAKNENGLLAYDDSEKQAEIISKTNTLRVPRGAEYQLVLSDGTKVWLNSDSELTYSVPFTGKERKVLLKGEAYFDVTPNKEMPFVVATENQDITVLGTEFNISAYTDDLNTITTLVEGKVKTTSLDNNEVVKENFLLPNEQLTLNKNSKKTRKRTVDPYPYIAWKEGRFSFKNESLESFFTKIARWYDVTVIIDNESIKDIRFTGDLPRYNNMSNILKVIEVEMSVKIKIENNKIIHVSK